MQLSSSVPVDAPVQINLGASNWAILDSHVAISEYMSKIINQFLDLQLRNMQAWSTRISMIKLYQFFWFSFHTKETADRAYQSNSEWTKGKIDSILQSLTTELGKRGLAIWSVAYWSAMRNDTIPVVPLQSIVANARAGVVQTYLGERRNVAGVQGWVNTVALKLSTLWRKQ